MFSLMPSRRNSFLRNLDDFFNLGDSNFSQNLLSDIKVDIRNDKEAYVLEAELPGLDKDDIQLTLKDDFLTIEVEKGLTNEEKTDNYIRRERSYGSFKRSFYLEGVDESKVKAKMDKGVLKVTLAKMPGFDSNTKKIEIE